MARLALADDDAAFAVIVRDFLGAERCGGAANFGAAGAADRVFFLTGSGVLEVWVAVVLSVCSGMNLFGKERREASLSIGVSGLAGEETAGAGCGFGGKMEERSNRGVAVDT